MISPAFSAALGMAWALLVAFLIYRAVRQYGKYELLTPLPPPMPAPRVCIIIPARNEESGIENCVSSLLGQDYPRDRLRLTVVDDNSTDATASIVGKLADQDARVRLLKGNRLPTGWIGKPHACWQAAQDAAAINEKADDDWLCFIDADTLSEPALISSAVARAQGGGFDMLSLEPFQILGTPGERLILPAGFFVLAFTQDLGRVNDPAAPDAKANGQFILIRRTVYDAIGGHAAVRAKISEDGALAKIVKGRGYRLGLIGAEALIRTRMFRNFSAVWNGLSRSAVDTVGGQWLTLFFSLGGLMLAVLAFAAPLLATLAFRHHSRDTLLLVGVICAWAGTFAMLGVHIGAAKHFHIPLYYGPLFPLGYVLAMLVGINSVIRHARGKVSWKDRTYSPAEATL